MTYWPAATIADLRACGAEHRRSTTRRGSCWARRARRRAPKSSSSNRALIGHPHRRGEELALDESFVSLSATLATNSGVRAEGIEQPRRAAGRRSRCRVGPGVCPGRPGPACRRFARSRTAAAGARLVEAFARCRSSINRSAPATAAWCTSGARLANARTGRDPRKRPGPDRCRARRGEVCVSAGAPTKRCSKRWPSTASPPSDDLPIADYPVSGRVLGGIKYAVQIDRQRPRQRPQRSQAPAGLRRTLIADGPGGLPGREPRHHRVALPIGRAGVDARGDQPGTGDRQPVLVGDRNPLALTSIRRSALPLRQFYNERRARNSRLTDSGRPHICTTSARPS